MSEEARLQALENLGILDTPAEERFERICRLAQEVMAAPATYISLIDRDRQWFKASRGIGDVQETPREGTFCDYAIERSRPTVVLNALQDPLFSHSPYVQEGPQVRFYTGFPLTVKGQRVGTLCALDFEPRQSVTPEQMEGLYDLARMAEAELARKPDLDVASERRTVTVLYSGLSNAVELEALPAELVVGVLHLYLEQMLAVLERWQGRLDGQGGSWLRVVFEQQLMAAGCAIDMQRTLREVNAALRERDLPALACGIGLHSGEVICGQLGGRPTLVGAALALAERIQSLSVAGQILASQATAEALGELALVTGKLRVTLPGLGEQTLYELAGVGELSLPDA